jgi:hypothetical protein
VALILDLHVRLGSAQYFDVQACRFRCCNLTDVHRCIIVGELLGLALCSDTTVYVRRWEGEGLLPRFFVPSGYARGFLETWSLRKHNCHSSGQCNVLHFVKRFVAWILSPSSGVDQYVS